jgi:hypothetical protein
MLYGSLPPKNKVSGDKMDEKTLEIAFHRFYVSEGVWKKLVDYSNKNAMPRFFIEYIDPITNEEYKKNAIKYTEFQEAYRKQKAKEIKKEKDRIRYQMKKEEKNK